MPSRLHHAGCSSTACFQNYFLLPLLPKWGAWNSQGGRKTGSVGRTGGGWSCREGCLGDFGAMDYSFEFMEGIFNGETGKKVTLARADPIYIFTCTQYASSCPFYPLPMVKNRAQLKVGQMSLHSQKAPPLKISTPDAQRGIPANFILELGPFRVRGVREGQFCAGGRGWAWHLPLLPSHLQALL